MDQVRGDEFQTKAKAMKMEIWIHIQGLLKSRGRGACETDGKEGARMVDGKSGPTANSTQPSRAPKQQHRAARRL